MSGERRKYGSTGGETLSCWPACGGVSRLLTTGWGKVADGARLRQLSGSKGEIIVTALPSINRVAAVSGTVGG